MVQEIIPIIRTAENTPAINVGGGAFHNTYHAITVLSEGTKGYMMKQASFIKTSGHLASSLEQAIVPVDPGDIVIKMKGKLPVSDLNPEATITAYRIISIADQTPTATAEQIIIKHQEIPPSIIRGAQEYHNREGIWFCMSPEEQKPLQED